MFTVSTGRAQVNAQNTIVHFTGFIFNCNSTQNRLIFFFFQAPLIRENINLLRKIFSNSPGQTSLKVLQKASIACIHTDINVLTSQIFQARSANYLVALIFRSLLSQYLLKTVFFK